MTKSKTTLAILVAGLLIGATTAATAQGHGHGQAGPGMMGQGMMGQGMEPGMMGQGMGPGMMGPGMMGQGMGQGMMGQGYGPGTTGDGMHGFRVVPMMHLSIEDVRVFLQHHIATHGLTHLKVGDISQTDDTTITADIVTEEGSLALRLEVDPYTGFVKDMS